MQYAVIDIEATGGSPKRDKITEIAIFLYDGKQIVDSFTTLVNPEISISPFVSRLTGITNDMVSTEPKFSEIADRVIDITKDAVFVAHNAQFDYAYIKAEFKRLGIDFERKKLCTVNLTKQIIPDLDSYSLGKLCHDLNIPIQNRHRAAGDAEATVYLFDLLLEKDEKSIIEKTLNNDLSYDSVPDHLDTEIIEKLPEETGIYFFHDEHGEVIFVGKSADIRRRVRQNFTGKTPKSRKWRMLRHTYDISYETTGSELIAQLLEFHYIKELHPKFNTPPRIRNLRYGIFKTYDRKGYLRLNVKEVKRGKKPIVGYEKETDAKLALERQIKNYHLCSKLCGIDEAKNGSPCELHKVNLCRGACIGKENVKSYNYRVHQSLKGMKYPAANFLIIGEGRTAGEQSILCVENNCFVGFGYFEQAETYNNIEDIKNGLQQLSPKPEIDGIVRAYLKRNKLDRVVKF